MRGSTNDNPVGLYILYSSSGSDSLSYIEEEPGNISYDLKVQQGEWGLTAFLSTQDFLYIVRDLHPFETSNDVPGQSIFFLELHNLR